MSSPLTVSNPTSNDGIDFSLQPSEFYSCIQLEIRKDWPVGFEAASLKLFTSICHEEQQTSDNLIVKDNCFIIEIFDKFSFCGILRGCVSHSNET